MRTCSRASRRSASVLDQTVELFLGPAADIADALFVIAAALVQGAPGGTFHFAGAPDASWADFARAIMAGAGLPCAVQDIATSAYPTPAQRPLNSRLDCASLAQFGISRPDWHRGLAQVLQELGADK